MGINCLPHASGGVSLLQVASDGRSESSPRQWGCFYSRAMGMAGQRVFPTPVGVFLTDGDKGKAADSLPHASGGVSNYLALLDEVHGSSPRQWGCFPTIPFCFHLRCVFPTPVGVFPLRRDDDMKRGRLPHASGGVSVSTYWLQRPCASSPRQWGCFHLTRKGTAGPAVFPTPVGVFPIKPVA